MITDYDLGSVQPADLCLLSKAKSVSEQVWVCGYYTKRVDENHAVSHEIYDVFLGKSVPIDPNTLCRCTGLIDKKGKLIWEFDVCARRGYWYPEVVLQFAGNWTLDYSHACGKNPHSDYANLGFYVCERGSVEVVASLFDRIGSVSLGLQWFRDPKFFQGFSRQV